MSTINPICKYPNGLARLDHIPPTDGWQRAVDMVDYPVYLKPLMFSHQHDGMADTIVDAVGQTNTGRETRFYGVVVDKCRDGNLSTISTVTDNYATIPAAEVYRSLQEDLSRLTMEHQQAIPRSLYVSGDGGSHSLTVAIPGFTWVTMEAEEIVMNVRLGTSVDGSARHSISLVPTIKETGVEVLGIQGRNMSLSTRHTKTIRERHVAFSHIIMQMMKDWDDLIVPSMVLLNDCKFDFRGAMDILESLLKEAELPAKHIDGACENFRRRVDREVQVSMMGILNSVSGYLEVELQSKQERLRTLKDKINTAAGKVT